MGLGADLAIIRDSKLHIELLCKNIPEGLLAGYTDMDTPACFINDCMLEYLGYNDQDEFNADNSGICFNFIHPDDRERVVAEVTEQHERGEKVCKAVYRVRKKNGDYIWMRAKSVLLKTHDGVPMLVSLYVDATDRHLLMDRVTRAELMLRAAVMHTRIGVWEYDLQAKSLTRIYSLPKFMILPEIMENVPTSIIESGIVCAESVPAIFELFRKIDEGETRASTEVQLYFKDTDSICWERIVLSVIFDDAGQAVNGIFISEDVTAEKEAELKYQHELQLRNTVSLGFIAAGRANLNKNKVEFMQTDVSWGSTDGEDMTYTRMMELETVYIANKEDIERYHTMFDCERLIREFPSGVTNISLDYRRKMNDGKIIWVNLSVKLLKDTASGDIYSYGVIRDINEQKIIELSLKQRAERDTLTGAYNRDTARSMIYDASLAAEKDEKEFAILLFSIDSFSKIIHQKGYAVGDIIIKELCIALNNELDEPKIIGRLFGDEIIVWMGGTPDKDLVLEKAEKVRRIINKSALVPNIGVEISLSVGLAFSEQYGKDPKLVVKKSQDALMVCKEIGGNCCIICDDQMNAGDEQLRVKTQQDIGEIVMRCAFALTYVTEPDKAIKGILQDLSSYYGAECSCFVELDTYNKGQVRNVCTYSQSEIKCKGNSFKDFKERIEIALDGKKRLFIDAMDADKEAKEEFFKKLGVHGTYTVALEINNHINGYISLSNPSLHNGDTTLLDLLSCILANDIDKRHTKDRQEYLSNYDELTGLLNRNSYLKFITEFSADSAISLGVMVADINGLKQINAQYGRASGDELVAFVAAKLKAISDGKAFRLAGDEFVLVCENITQDSFYKYMESLKMAIESEQSESVAFGYVWSDVDINPELLVTLADEKMMIAKQIYYKDGIKIIKRRDHKAERVLIDDIRNGRYEVYLQPKALVVDGIISGAEALIRYRNAQGELIPPVHFIPQLEQTGNIYHIDIFVFEEVCRLLKRWREEGRKLIPVSLNFSRVTLLRENLINDMEAIYNRYQVPKNLIEIEVAESMGSVERQTLIDISADIVKSGYQLSLDDFGAKYSNLSILSVLNLHVLKLDKSLVNDLLSNNNTRKVLRNFLKTCSDLNIVSVAEGVETKEQLDILKDLGCDYAQGYYFNKPIPLKDFERLYL